MARVLPDGVAVIALLVLFGCARENVCFGDCDTAPEPTYEGDWTGTISAVYSTGWGEDWPCTGPATGSIDAELAFVGEATCGEGDQEMSGSLVGAVVGQTFTATWTVHVWEEDPRFDVHGTASYEAIEATFADDGWNVSDGEISLSPDNQ